MLFPKIMIGINIFLLLISILTPLMFFTSLLEIYQATILICGGIYLWLVGTAFYNKQSGSGLVLIGVVLICFSFVYDIINTVTMEGGLHITALAVMVFLILQSQLVALRAAQAYKKSEQLTLELQTKNDEITFFNKNLEKIVATKTKEIRSLLDHIPQGVCSIIQGAVTSKDYSAHLVNILGTDLISDQSFDKLVLKNTGFNIDTKDQIMQSIHAIIGEDVINFEANRSNLPNEMTYTIGNETKFLKTTWNVEIDENEFVQRILLTLLDISHEKILEQKASDQAQLLELVKELIEVSADRAAQFFATGLPLLLENQRIIDHSQLDHSVVRLLFVNAHTVKGAARSLQLKSLAAAIHQAEDGYTAILKGEESVNQKQLRADCKNAIDIFNSYIFVNREKLNRFDDLTKLTIDREFIEKQYFILKDLVDAPNPNVRNLIKTIRDHSEALTSMIFEQLTVVLDEYIERARKIARDIGKPEPEVVIDATPIPITTETKILIDKCMIHILRNSLDHGLELAEDRKRKLKPISGLIKISAQLSEGFLQIRVEDDGQGLAIDKLREKGIDSGIIRPHASLTEVAESIFRTGISTAQGVTNISGRGVGMDAVRSFLQEVNGSISIQLGKENVDKGYYHFYLLIQIPYPSKAEVLVDQPGKEGEQQGDITLGKRVV